MTTITIEVPGDRLPIRYPARIFQPEDIRTAFYSRLTGPEDAFRLMEGNQYDKVKVIKPDLVEIKTFQVL
jgi:hypothetical protein